jgi:hypothetical protein
MMSNQKFSSAYGQCRSEELLGSLSDHAQSVFIVSPFIKVKALERLLSRASSAAKLTIVTRWRASEIAAGVSDLGVFNVCQQRRACQLYLLGELHAKYYRVDDIVFVGSANLTDAGMGWSERPNIEILQRQQYSSEWSQWEHDLLASACEATDDILSAVQAAVDTISVTTLVHECTLPVAEQSGGDERCGLAMWCPATRFPEGVFDFYSKRYNRMTSASQLSAARDLSHLRIPSGLTDTQLRLCIRASLLQQPIVSAVNGMVADSPRFGELRQRVRRRMGDVGAERNYTELTQTIMRWLVYFFPEQYRIQVYRFSEHLERFGRAP